MSDCNETKTSDRVYKWLMLVMLAVTYFLMHGSRQVFNASLPQIKVDLAGHGASSRARSSSSPTAAWCRSRASRRTSSGASG